MAATPQQSSLSGLARALVQAGKIKEAEAESLLTQAAASKISFIEQFVTTHKASTADIARFASDTFGYPLLDLFIGLWATFQILWQQLVCPNLLHS